MSRDCHAAGYPRCPASVFNSIRKPGTLSTCSVGTACGTSRNWPTRLSPICSKNIRPAGRPQDGVAAECRRDREAAGGAIDPPTRRFEEGPPGRVRAIMGVRTRGLDMRAGFKRDAADRAARADAKAVVDRWNEQLAAGRDMLWSPTIRAAMLADTCSAPGAGRAAPSISAPSTVTRSPRSVRWSSGCDAHGVQGQRRPTDSRPEKMVQRSNLSFDWRNAISGRPIIQL